MIHNREVIEMIEDMRMDLSIKKGKLSAFIALLEREPGARELAHAKTKLQEAKHWVEDALEEIKLAQQQHNDIEGNDA